MEAASGIRTNSKGYVVQAQGNIQGHRVRQQGRDEPLHRVEPHAGQGPHFQPAPSVQLRAHTPPVQDGRQASQDQGQDG